jgi:hypothetical protein
MDTEGVMPTRRLTYKRTRLKVTEKEAVRRTASRKTGTGPLVPGTLAWAFSFTGGHRKAVEYLRWSRDRDPEMIDKFMEAWSELTEPEREAVESMDRICRALDFNPRTLLEYVVGYSFSVGDEVTKFMDHMLLPSLYKKSYQAGMRLDGFDDRNAILQQKGLHYAPKGGGISITQNMQQLTATPGLPDLETVVHGLHDILSEPRQLPASTAVEVEPVIEMETVEQE